MFASLETFFKPKTIAIVGASESGGAGWPKGLYENFAHEGFPAEVYLVNPRRQELWGKKVYPNFSELPVQLDLAIFIIPAEVIPKVLSEAAEKGLKNALIFASRFGEGDDEIGMARAKKLKQIIDQSQLRISGPNCMGAISVPERLLFYPTSRVRGLPLGHVGVVFQSGGTFQFWLEQGAARGLGYSYAVSSGNELDLDMADYINFLVNDPQTNVIVCMAEGVRRPAALMLAAERALSAGKPILMLKVGRTSSGQEAVRTHTGALATDDHAFVAMCHKYGIVLANTLDELIEMALAFSSGRRSRGYRVAMVGYSGGAKGLFLDLVHNTKLELPKFSTTTQKKLTELIDSGVPPSNPLDTGAGLARDFDKFSKVCSLVAQDENIDMISVQGQLPIQNGSAGDPKLFRRILDSTSKFVLAHNRMSQNVNDVGRIFQKDAGMPFIQRLPELATTLNAVAYYSDCLRREILQVQDFAVSGEKSVKKIIQEAGIFVPRSRNVLTVAEVPIAAKEIGFPVAIKIVSEQVTHKTEVGGVILNVRSSEEALKAANSLVDSFASKTNDAVIDGFLIQKIVHGVEIIMGIRDDPQFGPLLGLGFGGVLVEAVKDIAFRLLPVTEVDVLEMIASLNAYTLLGEFRGAQEKDIGALVSGVTKFANTYGSVRENFQEVEVNPLIVAPKGRGVFAVDIRTIARPSI